MSTVEVPVFKPLLAGKAPENLADVRYPVIASPKIDGIRCLIGPDGVPVSRTMKPIPNAFVTEMLTGMPRGLDGELWVRGARTFGEVSSAIMARDGEPNFEYIVFDHFDSPSDPYELRLVRVSHWVSAARHTRVRLIPYLRVHNEGELLDYESICLKRGQEGVMLRDPNGRYKFGRSSTREGILLKLKRFEDSEAVVIGVEERMHNENEATRDAFGRTERSSHKAGLRPAGDLGKLICRTPGGIEFGIGTGFSAEQRRGMWQIRHALIGRIAKYRHQPHGAKEAPRCPVFLGFRHPDDMGE